MSTDAVARAEAEDEDDREFDGLFARHTVWKTLLGTFLVAVIAISAIERSAPEPAPADFDEPAGWADVEDALRAAAADPAERVVLVLGDSVLRPNVMRERFIEDAENFTPVAWARRLAEADVAFYDLSLDGLLPADMLTIVSRLDEFDPEGRVELVVELSPRYLSPDYAPRDRQHSRGFLERPERYWPIEEDIEAGRLVHHRLGLSRARRALGRAIAQPERLVLAGARPEPTLATRLRVARHFLRPETSGPQLAAIERLLPSFRHVLGRPVLFFFTPVNGRGLGQAERTPPAVLEAKLLFHGLLHDESGPVEDPELHRFRDFDDDSFREDDFLDHVHLTPSANARLAARILRALGIPRELEAATPSRRTLLPTIAGATGGAFVGRNRVVLARADETAILLDLESGLGLSSGKSLPREIAASSTEGFIYWRQGETGELELVELLFGFDLERLHLAPLDGWPFHEPPRFDLRGRTMVAVAGRILHRIVLSDRHLATGPATLIEGSIELPEALRDATPRIGAQQLYLAPPDGAGGHREIHSISFEDLQAGRVDRIELFARCSPDPAWERDFVAAKGLRQKARGRLAMPFDRFASIHVGGAGDGLVLEASLPGAPGAIAPWWLSTRAGVVQALVTPARDGLVLDPDDARRDLPQRLLAFDAQSGRALVERRAGMEVVETTLLHRSDWIYGSPPWPEEDIVVANGFTYRRPEARDWRIGLFGNSRLGASYPGGKPDSRGLMSSLSLATELSRQLDRRLAESPYRAQALDYSQARSDLLRCLATLQHVDAAGLDLALIAIDDESLGDPDRPGDAAAPRLPERYRAIRRDEAGRPLISLQAGFRPRLVLDEIAPAGSVEKRAAMADCLTEIASLARSRGLDLVFVDLSGLDETEDPELPQLLETIRALELPLLDARALIVAENPDLGAYSYGKDPHLRPETIRSLSRGLAREFETAMWKGLMERDLRGELLGGRAPPSSLLPTGALLDSLAARREDVEIERSLADGARLIYDLGPEPEEVKHWRRALALLGLRGAPALEEDAELVIEIIRFENYDEYGLGRDDAPVLVARFSIAAADLRRASSEVEAALAGEQPPPWLRSP